MRYLFVIVFLGHGLVHLLGFAKAFAIGRVPLAQAVSRPLGALWLVAALLFATAAILIAAESRLWWAPACLALLVSQLLIFGAWREAWAGTIVNGFALIGVAIALLPSLPSSFRSTYEKETTLRAAPSRPPLLVTRADLDHLPPLVSRYLEVTGAIGRPRVENFRAQFRGKIKRSPTSSWLPFRAEQHNFYAERARLFLMDASFLGIPFTAFHAFTGTTATMKVRVASLIDVVDARGPEMDQSETVTLFNDMCVLAPATLIDRSIRWKALDEHSVRAFFMHGKSTISATLSFNARGELTDFVSDDRYQSADGKTYTRYPWSTPLRDYDDFGGVRLARRGNAIWRTPAGDLLYGRFELLAIEYNVGN
jgi:hypothetical protein